MNFRFVVSLILLLVVLLIGFAIFFKITGTQKGIESASSCMGNMGISVKDCSAETISNNNCIDCVKDPFPKDENLPYCCIIKNKE